ncbi:hypothetical protein PSTG_14714 [Puccinia striiformis f. sp. tritici PST-78]|uniref:Uncharacterized protein n=1 Tax=Puccinia striiformis f. sp. tritici PST-78 TaxID=1165861 RepID=A0A0L0UXW3_9BASI|nr:hypothetical protein PSTG_14714 [Puccinia striiformis f. sp. tritici PST-78]
MSSTHDDPPHLTSSKANNNSSAKVAGIPVLTPPGPDTNFLSWWYVVRGYLASIELSYVLDPTNQKTAPPLIWTALHEAHQDSSACGRMYWL